ncbi:uncharacterized protein [Littorina saxatilis]|uniref:uncharacterized protein n=1 Tax=Littorina saxatilis TaxID=31220 RepID=UPI0038B4B83C
MAGRRGGPSVHHSMQRNSNRAEFKDAMLRVNQRQENRLALELEQWERAQRMVAKGLDKESQWFKQRQAVGPAKHRKRPSLTGDHSSEVRLIPDYHFNRAYTNLGTSTTTNNDHNAEDVADGGEELGGDRKSVARGKSGAGGKEEERKKGGAKHSEPSKTPHGAHHKATKHQRDRPAHDEDGAQPKHDDGDDVSKSTSDVTKGKGDDSKPQKLTEAALQSLNITTAERPGDSPTKPSATTTADLQPTTAPLAAGGAVMTSEADGMMYGYPPEGRRRSGNVWDSLSMPKNQSQVRSVRERLQREFTQIPSSAARRGSEGRRGSDTRLTSATTRRPPKPSF